MSLIIGITGGIGSGKSIVSELLDIMGIPVYISDTESKRLTVNDPYIRQQLINQLGENVYINGELNKPLLAGYLFGNPDHAKVINGIIHPRVKEDFRRWVNTMSNHPVVAMEAAILIEAGFASEVDKVVMVSAPLNVRIERATSRDNTTQDAVLQRIKAQMPDEEKEKEADFIIRNDGNKPLIPQVEHLIKVLTVSGT